MLRLKILQLFWIVVCCGILSVCEYLDNDYYYSAEDATPSQESQTVNSVSNSEPTNTERNPKHDVDYKLNPELTKTNRSTSLHNNALSDNFLNPLFTGGSISGVPRNAATIIQKSTDVQKLQSPSSAEQQTSVTATNQSNRAENASIPATAYELFYAGENEFPIEKYFEVLNNVNSSDELLSVEDIFKSSKNTNQIDLNREVTSDSELEDTEDTSTVGNQYEDKNIRDRRIKQILEKLQANETLSNEKFVKYYEENNNNQFQSTKDNDNTGTSKKEEGVMTKVSIPGFEGNTDNPKTQFVTQTETAKTAQQTVGMYDDNINLHKDNDTHYRSEIPQIQENQAMLNSDYLDDIISGEERALISDLSIAILGESGGNKANVDELSTTESFRAIEIDPDMYDYEAHSKEVDAVRSGQPFSNTDILTEQNVPLLDAAEPTTSSNIQTKLLQQKYSTDESVVLPSELDSIHTTAQELATTASVANTEKIDVSRKTEGVVHDRRKTFTTDENLVKSNISKEGGKLSNHLVETTLDDSPSFRYNAADQNGNICFRVRFKGTIQTKETITALPQDTSVTGICARNYSSINVTWASSDDTINCISFYFSTQEDEYLITKMHIRTSTNNNTKLIRDEDVQPNHQRNITISLQESLLRFWFVHIWMSKAVASLGDVALPSTKIFPSREFVMEVVGVSAGTIIIIGIVYFGYRRFKTKTYDAKAAVA